MIYRHIAVLCTLLLLSSCSFSYQSPSGEIQIPSISLSGNLSATGTHGQIELPDNLPVTNRFSVGMNETKDIDLSIINNKGVLHIDAGTGARIKVHFISIEPKNLSVNLQTPGDAQGNIRISQIVFPDGTSDGPFGKELKTNITQSGSYQIILSANMMAGDPWSGKIDMNLELK